MLLYQALLSSTAVGLGCGAGCGSAASAFLMTYILAEGRKITDAIRQVATFYFGKLLAVVLVCCACAYAGRTFIGEDGYLAGFPLTKVVSWMILLCGSWLIWGWIQERKSCAHCRHCHCKGSVIPSFAVGMAYGLSPCAPLLMVLGYSITLTVPGAILLAFAFTLASSLFPAILTLGLAGILSVNISLQLGKHLSTFRLLVYGLYLLVGFAGVIYG